MTKKCSECGTLYDWPLGIPRPHSYTNCLTRLRDMAGATHLTELGLRQAIARVLILDAKAEKG